MKYDVVKRKKERSLPNGVKTTYEYDDLDRIKSIVHTNAQGNVLTSVTYERTGIGEPSKITRDAKYGNNHQYTPVTLFITFIAPREGERKKIEKAAWKDGVSTAIVSIFPLGR